MMNTNGHFYSNTERSGYEKLYFFADLFWRNSFIRRGIWGRLSSETLLVPAGLFRAPRSRKTLLGVARSELAVQGLSLQVTPDLIQVLYQ